MSVKESFFLRIAGRLISQNDPYGPEEQHLKIYCTQKSDLRRDRFYSLLYSVMISSIKFGAVVGSLENSIYL